MTIKTNFLEESITKPLHMTSEMMKSEKFPELSLVKEIKSAFEKEKHSHFNVTVTNKIKLLRLIDPVKDSDLELKIDSVAYSEDHYGIQAMITKEDKVFFKFKGTFTLSDN